jgi:ribosomal protein S12 methylthiotransferase accessory factor YcaO
MNQASECTVDSSTTGVGIRSPAEAAARRAGLEAVANVFTARQASHDGASCPRVQPPHVARDRSKRLTRGSVRPEVRRTR